MALLDVEDVAARRHVAPAHRPFEFERAAIRQRLFAVETAENIGAKLFLFLFDERETEAQTETVETLRGAPRVDAGTPGGRCCK